MQYDSPTLGALTFKNLFKKTSALVKKAVPFAQKAAPLIVAATPQAQNAAVAAPAVYESGVAPSFSDAGSRPAWMIPALIGGGLLLAGLIFKRKYK
jgi:hypothetical protein